MDISQYAASPEAVIEQTKQSIIKFFQRYDGGVTQEDCDRLAARLLGMSVSPAPVQGETSYTVVASSSNQWRTPELVQFWPTGINMEYYKLARIFYKDLVPGCKFEDTLGYVNGYMLDRVQGRAFRLVARELLAPDGYPRLLRTVNDLARFYASAWSLGPWHEPSAVQRDQYYQELARVSLVLGEEFQPKLDEIRQGLPLLLESKAKYPTYPTVVQHKKLNDATIHVDENTGRLTGVTDWADSNVVYAPFGVTLCGVEALLGIHSLNEYHFHPRHAELRNCFWRTLFADLGHGVSQKFGRSIKIAWSYGLLVHFGVFWRDSLHLTNARRTFLRTLLLS